MLALILSLTFNSPAFRLRWLTTSRLHSAQQAIAVGIVGCVVLLASHWNRQGSDSLEGFDSGRLSRVELKASPSVQVIIQSEGGCLMLRATKIWVFLKTLARPVRSVSGCEVQFLETSRSAMAHALSTMRQSSRAKRNPKDQHPHRNKGQARSIQ